MSAASTPAPPRSSGSSSASRHTLFLPMLIFLMGFGTFSVYQVMNLEDQLDSVTRAVDQMDAKVKRGQYERAKFYSLVRDVLAVAPKDANAEEIVARFNLRELEPSTATLSEQSPQTNAAANFPVESPVTATNGAPVNMTPPVTPPPPSLNPPSPVSK